MNRSIDTRIVVRALLAMVLALQLGAGLSACNAQLPSEETKETLTACGSGDPIIQTPETAEGSAASGEEQGEAEQGNAADVAEGDTAAEQEGSAVQTAGQDGAEEGSEDDMFFFNKKNSDAIRKVSASEAQQIMDTQSGYVIVDVRTADEYAEGHVPGAINVDNYSLGSTPPAELPDKDQMLLVYCRSGRRSADAARKLAAMGYTNIVDFGGIIDWTGEVATD